MGYLRRKSPLFRRKSSRNVSAIEVEVEDVIQRSPFLQAAASAQEHHQQTNDHYHHQKKIRPQYATPHASENTSDLRQLPLATFQRKEFQVGTLLGTGSFASVHAIIGYKLSSSTSSGSSGSGIKKLHKQHHRTSSSCSLSDGSLKAISSSVSVSSGAAALAAFAVRQQGSRVALSQTAFDADGTARYAVKFVKKELVKNAHAFRNAAADLVVEAKYLEALDHRNIIKLRGIGQEGSASFLDGHDGFFLIVDRLQETLQERIESWKQLPFATPAACTEGQLQVEQQRFDLLTLQTDYSLQVGEALAYLHDRRIIYRDLKPQNIGFRPGDPHTVQLFDFGLCRELPDCNADSNDGHHHHHHHHHDDDVDDLEEVCSMMFRMSGAGTYVYMAPEVILKKTYNLKCDVYSWALMFHEMIALERPFEQYSVVEHREFVCEIGQRPSLTLDINLPVALQGVLKESWEQDPKVRLTMKQACHKLQAVLQEFHSQQRQQVLLQDDVIEKNHHHDVAVASSPEVVVS